MNQREFLEKHRITTGSMASTSDYGFNGCFMFNMPGEVRPICCIASDGGGWRHVSVSFGGASTKTPSWDVMCFVKEKFWTDDEVVIQIHPKKSEYVNFHKGCLHMWQCIDGREQPTPPSIFVGPKT